MKTMYKLVTQEWTTQNNTKWSINQTNTAKLPGNALCSGQVLHCYSDPRLAVIFNPVQADIPNPILLEICCSELINTDGLKHACKEQTPIRRIALPAVSMTQKVAFAIKTALLVYHAVSFVTWANNWLANSDRTAYAARAAADAADAAGAARAAAYAADAAYAARAAAAYAARAAAARAAGAAAYAAAYAARAAAYAAGAAAYAARAAAYAADAARAAARAAADAADAADAARAAAYAADAAGAAAYAADAAGAAARAAGAAAYAADAAGAAFGEKLVEVIDWVLENIV